MTGELVKAMRACPQPIIAAVEGICAGRWRDHGDGVRHAARRDRRQGRLLVQQSRPCRLRHGRLRDPAAHHRPGACAPSCYTPAASWARRRASAGASSAASSRRTRCSRRRRRWPNQISEGPTYANTMTKRMLSMEWAMSIEEAIEAEAVRAGAVHDHRGFRAGVSRASRTSRSRCSRAIERCCLDRHPRA